MEVVVLHHGTDEFKLHVAKVMLMQCTYFESLFERWQSSECKVDCGDIEMKYYKMFFAILQDEGDFQSPATSDIVEVIKVSLYLGCDRVMQACSMYLECRLWSDHDDTVFNLQSLFCAEFGKCPEGLALRLFEDKKACAAVIVTEWKKLREIFNDINGIEILHHIKTFMEFNVNYSCVLTTYMGNEFITNSEFEFAEVVTQKTQLYPNLSSSIYALWNQLLSELDLAPVEGAILTYKTLQKCFSRESSDIKLESIKILSERIDKLSFEGQWKLFVTWAALKFPTWPPLEDKWDTFWKGESMKSSQVVLADWKNANCSLELTKLLMDMNMLLEKHDNELVMNKFVRLLLDPGQTRPSQYALYLILDEIMKLVVAGKAPLNYEGRLKVSKAMFYCTTRFNPALDMFVTTLSIGDQYKLLQKDTYGILPKEHIIKRVNNFLYRSQRRT